MAASLAINRLVDGKDSDSDSEEADKTSRMSGSGGSAPLLEELSIAKPKDRLGFHLCVRFASFREGVRT